MAKVLVSNLGSVSVIFNVLLSTLPIFSILMCNMRVLDEHLQNLFV